MARNIELKARLDDLAAARSVAQRLATAPTQSLQQVDTYFHFRPGLGKNPRLKLRETSGQIAQLIWYDRPDAATAKESDYLLCPIMDAHTLKQTLSAALGVRGVVEKEREVWLHDNVRIHLDQVRNLGAFLEFEAVLSAGDDDVQGHAQLARLAAEFGLAADRWLAGSYSDLLGL